MNTEQNEQPPFRVGDLVTTDFYVHERDLVRKVTSVEKSDGCRSGWAVSADQGERCQCCDRPNGTPINGMKSVGVDSMVQKSGAMRTSAQQQLTDHLAAMLEKSGFARETVEVATDCPACNGEGFTHDGTKLALCETCNGQRLIVTKQEKI